MKFNKILPLLFAFLILAGCSKDSPVTDTPVVGPVIDKSANLRALGDSANELLSDTKFTSLNIEIVYVSGYNPSQQTLVKLKQFLQARVYKPDGISISTRAVTTSGKAPFTIEEIAEIERNERQEFNAGDEISVFIYFADGSNENDDDTNVVLGSAFRNTSMVIYGKTVNKIAASFNAPDKSVIETTVINHEFGHLFGLVDNGTPMLVDHLDPDSDGHCSVNGCLMNANILFSGSLIDMIDNNQVVPLENLCIQDLQANGGK